MGFCIAMLSFLLFSDLHLGAGGEAPVADEKRRETFLRIISLAREHDLLLIAGDLFDGNPSPEVLNEVSDAFAKLSADGVKVLMAPGEHEIDENGKILKSVLDLPLTALFADPVNGSEFVFEKNGERIIVYGLPGIPSMKLPLLSNRTDGSLTIGLFHGEVCLSGSSSETGAMVLLKNEMMNSGIDFFALGHHHQFKLFKHNRRLIGAYAGSPEAVSFEERGERYVLSFAIEGGEITQIKRLTVNSIDVEECTFFGSDFDSWPAFCKALEEKKSEKKALKVTLRGTRNFSFDDDSMEKIRIGFHCLLFDDISEPSLEAIIEQYRGAHGFKGDFINQLESDYHEQKIPPGISPDEVARVLWSFMKEKKPRAEENGC